MLAAIGCAHGQQPPPEAREKCHLETMMDEELVRDAPLDPERQADAFASDLILPNYLLGPRLRRIKRPTLAAAREIAEHGTFDALNSAIPFAEIDGAFTKGR